MPAPSLAPWFLVGLLAAACGPEPPLPNDPQVDSSAGQGGSGIVIASSDGASLVGSTTSMQSGGGGRTAAAPAAASAGTPHTTASATSTSSSNHSGVDGAGGAPTSSGAAAGGIAGHGGDLSGAGGVSPEGGVGHEGDETTTGEEVVPPIPVGALLVSEYVEGSSGSDKALELSNTSDDVLGLGACQLIIYFNGKSTPGAEIPLMGELPPGSTHTLCHSKCSAEIMARCDQATGSASFNGNDAIVLDCDGVAHDGIGQVGVPLGADQWGDSALGTKDQILRRRCGSMPRTEPTSTFDIALDWENVSDEDFVGALAGLGDPACVEPEARVEPEAKPSEP